MKTLLPAAIGAALAFSSVSEAASVHVSPNRGVQAIGGIVVEGVEYDVCFDGSFGGTIFLGNETGAQAAGEAIATLFNGYLGSGYFPWPLPTVDNGAGGGPNGTGQYFEITTVPGSGAERDFILCVYAAGWATWNPSEPSSAGGNFVEAYFRPAIPGSIQHNVPEPSAMLLGAVGLLLMSRRRR